MDLLAQGGESWRVLDSHLHHLRNSSEPEWEEFAGKTPQGPRLDLTFTAEPNFRESTLFIRQDNVKFEWPVELNGRRIGQLQPSEAHLVQVLTVQPGFLRQGENTLSIIPPREGEDIVVGDIQLALCPVEESLSATLKIRVTDKHAPTTLPCRITIVDEKGALAAVTGLRAPDRSRKGETLIAGYQRLAVRPGVVYTADGQASLRVRAGTYTIYASRGPEYGIDRKKVSLKARESRGVGLRIGREVSTPGLVSSDPHVHTFTHSRHGDASIEERMITIAGEGIELPIATDHNLQVDYSTTAHQVGVHPWFTPVVGNEVTTKAGHFNVFPVALEARPPDWKIESWPDLMKSIRSTPGVQVIVLNHPRDLHSNFRPFGSENFNPVTGENRRGPEFEFNAIELINSGALQSDFMQVYRDWFALLNYGYRVTGVGSSDSHDVSRYVIGQGRTYIACPDDRPSAIPITEACHNLRQGRALVSLGLVTDMTVDGRFQVGALATGLNKSMQVTISVQGASWTTIDRVELFANGIKIREKHLGARAGPRNKVKLAWNIPKPAQDVHLVALATGPGALEPFWPLVRPYQPTSRTWRPQLIGSTNPIWIDADGDGKFTSARGYAAAVISQTGYSPAKLLPALAFYDQAVAAQAASLCQQAGHDIRQVEYAAPLQTAAQPVRNGFAAFTSTLPPR